MEKTTKENPAPVSLLGGIPAGWKLVPLEPTEEMRASVDCAGEKWLWLSGKAWASGWKSMVMAAPKVDLVDREQHLEDALCNLMGIYDTPLSRRRFPPDDFMNEALTFARDLLGKDQP